jgi:hypothetical protein
MSPVWLHHPLVGADTPWGETSRAPFGTLDEALMQASADLAMGVEVTSICDDDYAVLLEGAALEQAIADSAPAAAVAESVADGNAGAIDPALTEGIGG